MRHRRFAVAGTAVVAVLAAGGAVLTVRGGAEGTAAAERRPLDTVTIARGDLVDTKTVDGTLTYAGGREVTGAAAGIVTSIPKPGQVIEQGEALYRVARRPVVLMYGKLPLYRTLRAGIPDGPDVEQLERSLRALGHADAVTVDDHFSSATARAVRAWQDAAGLAETGTVDAAQVVFLPGAARVAEAKAAVGDRVGPGTVVLAVSGTERVVHVDLKVTDQALARRGGPATVELPNGTTLRGKIVSVDGVAERKGSGQGEPAGAAAEPTVDVVIEPSGDADTGGLDRTPVTVTLVSERRARVLTVPVEALLALREGGLGVELVGPDGGRRVVAVRTGAFGGGRVEISGPEVREGLRVGVPRA
ncbi:HlyD family efflux transporter periplasmic adaptor subunit [Actinomadura spongiicola]|uniref:HlyD family efflux transporter periplasmic adaptor subunit n=1 Tax=Actinomadura spongiicola TaxID=2303421 RepID=A0A372GDR6_9ACTN|nr:peptidoglycan-binding protein [Actinomadura spongiicola]RFS83477.1 HlyD family efflux transporter periplasmic adaptor subunit [Actinomadura spongiicola]